MISTQNLAPTRLSNIQALRGGAALLVVLFHLYQMEFELGGATILPNFFSLGYVGVDLFFVISGFIMVYVTWDTRPALKTSAEFFFARASRIYPIYWLMASALLAVWTIYPSLLSAEHTVGSIIKSFLLWPDAQLPMLTVAWTLVHEMYFYLVFAIILFVPNKWRLAAILLWTGFVAFGNKLGLSGTSPELRLVFNALGLEFSLGAIAAWFFKAHGGVAGSTALILGLIGWVAAYIYQLGYSGNAYPSFQDRVWLFGIPGAFITYGLAATEMRGHVLPKWSETFGNWSYSLYLSHLLLLGVLGMIWQKVSRVGMIDNLIAVPLILAIAIVASWLIYKFTEKPLINGAKALRRKLFTPPLQPHPQEASSEE